MSRLIDADLLKQNCKCTGGFNDNFMCVDLITLAEVIDNQPTAFDTEQVIHNLGCEKTIWVGKKITTTEVMRIDDAIDIANGIAPEHLEICVNEPFEYLKKVKHAGSVFLGRYCPEAIGDYFAGTNHTLPTSGTAKFSSPLSVDDFVKKTQYIYYDKSALGEVCRDVEYFAKKEGLTAHAKSAVIRFEEK